MKDIRSRFWLVTKAVLFVLLGGTSVALILMEHPESRVAILLAIAVWSFCRSYYFAFYVIEHYIDSSFRFSGLWSAVRFLLRK